MTDPVALPSDRVKDSAVFEVVGVDLDGPLYVKRGDKNNHTHLEEDYANYRKPPDGADTVQGNNRIVMAQRKHLDDFLRGIIIGRLECGRTQLEVSEELGITQNVISRL
ncbi:acyl-CoA synthetase family member 2, mitochondrial [Trichonephila clavipes]|nr:acyl-CoA synthetase family member 2, mitochondrial [Trichonephila clavipes]